MDKPAGPTSHDVVLAARRALGQSRAGHAGTLDPPATGLLVVLAGRATRLARFVAMVSKTYVGTIRFGWETSTDDATGTPLAAPEERFRDISREDLAAALDRVRAQPLQVPPAVSAKKVDGVRAYRLARRGEPAELEAVPVLIYDLQLLGWDAASGSADIAVECSAGTYVRALARDVGRALGTAAHLAALRRTAIGRWTVHEAVELATLVPGVMPPLRPMAEAVSHLPAVILPHGEAEKVRHGRQVEAGREVSGPVAVFDSTGLIAVADSRAGVLHPEVVLAA